MKKPFLFWRDDWQLGLDCLDDQHMELAKILNKLHSFIVVEGKQNHEGMKQLSQHLKSLVNITRRHFKAEEALMRTHEYPGLTEHHREHVLLLAELHECIRDIKTGSKPFTLETLTALKHWQINHTLYSDKMFADYLIRQSQTENDGNFDTMTGGQTQPC
jgi:hemerythrin